MAANEGFLHVTGWASCLLRRRSRDGGAPPSGFKVDKENLPADFAGTYQCGMAATRASCMSRGGNVLFVKTALPRWWSMGMASRSKVAGTKRNSLDGDRLPEIVKERLLHMELENGFLEERTKLLEEEGRKYRLRIDELRAELRETTNALLQYKNRVAEYSSDLREQLEANDAAREKISSLIEENKALRRQIDQNDQPGH
ncbi:hypothetical protein R1sor_008988 [Riccia sorocarpa]|uniref:Uncharacterized protein n=1 Tax=Riccia sorocarpa TaxID=122646 RepID=A0ABD3H7C0_9MARC